MRLTNRLLSTILAGVLAAFSALVAVEIVLGYYLDRNPWLLPWERWYDRSRELSWSDRPVVVTFVLIGVAGVVLLVAELWRRPPTSFPLAGETSDVHAEITRHSLDHVLTRAALHVDGITGAHTRSRRQRVTLDAATERRLLGDLRTSVTTEADAALTHLQLQQRPRLVVKLTGRRPAKASA